MINKDKLLRLMNSPTEEDFLIALELMVGISKRKVEKLFKVKEYESINKVPIKGSGFNIYKISDTCFIGQIGNRFIVPKKDCNPEHVTDLTKNR